VVAGIIYQTIVPGTTTGIGVADTTPATWFSIIFATMIAVWGLLKYWFVGRVSPLDIVKMTVYDIVKLHD
jgi:hypothetical protein